MDVLLEHFIKTLKDFVRQNARLECSMSEGWLNQEILVFIAQYLYDADSSLLHPFSITNSKFGLDVRVQDGPIVVHQGLGRQLILDRDLHARLNKFFILNSDDIRPRLATYHEARICMEREHA